METRILREIGLTEGESKVYLALLKIGLTTIGPLTDQAKVSRSKIYHILNRLIEKGIVSYITKEKTKYFQAENPTKIKEYINKKEKEFEKQKREFEKILPALILQKQNEKTKSEVQVYKGFNGIQTILDHVYSTLKKGETFYDVGIPSFQEEKYHEYWKKEDHPRRIKLGINCKMLFSLGTPENVLKNRNKYKGCEARYMPIELETPAWILTYKDVAVIILQGDEPIAIEITNKQIAKSFKEYFDAFWKLSKPFKTNHRTI